MKRRPRFGLGDVVQYTAGRRGFHYGLSSNTYVVVAIMLAAPLPDKAFRRGEWGGWLVQITNSNMWFPAGWFQLKKETTATEYDDGGEA